MKLKFNKSEQIEISNKYEDYLLRESAESCGTVNKKEDYYIMHNDKKYVCYSFEYIYSSELSNDIAIENRKNMTVLLDYLKGHFKIFYLRDYKSPMKDVFEKTLALYREQTSENIKMLLAEELDLLNGANKKEYAISYIMVEKNQEETFLRRAERFLYLTKIENEKGIALLKRLNNGF